MSIELVYCICRMTPTDASSGTLEIEIKNIFMTNSFSIQDNGKVPIIQNWHGREGLQFMQILKDKEKENVNQVWGCL